MSGAARIVPAGDSTLVMEFEDRIDPAVNDRVIAVADALAGDRVPGVRDIVPTYRSIAVYFDPLRTSFDALLALMARYAESAPDTAKGAHRLVRIPVCYGAEFGPDLEAVAEFARATPDEVIQLHRDTTYRVFMLGFVAGFAYMGTVAARIAMPRHATPRVRVPIGSVGIAGVQTGVYPAETPGGWQLIGRTPVKPFDASRAEPFLMKAGDAVQFYPISRTEYETWPSA